VPSSQRDEFAVLCSLEHGAYRSHQGLGRGPYDYVLSIVLTVVSESRGPLLKSGSLTADSLLLLRQVSLQISLKII